MKNVLNSILLVILLNNLIFSQNSINPQLQIENIKKEIQSELNHINLLDEFIGNDYDLNSVIQEQPEMVKNAGLSSEMEFDAAGSNGAPLGIPGFLWGFCLGLIGILIVYLATSEGSDRKKHVNQALYGCLAWSALYLILVLTGVIKIANVEPKLIETAAKILVA
jgi:hypothetical protein